MKKNAEHFLRKKNPHYELDIEKPQNSLNAADVRQWDSLLDITGGSRIIRINPISRWKTVIFPVLNVTAYAYSKFAWKDFSFVLFVRFKRGPPVQSPTTP